VVLVVGGACVVGGAWELAAGFELNPPPPHAAAARATVARPVAADMVRRAACIDRAPVMVLLEVAF
jgi:hypothetical protein